MSGLRVLKPGSLSLLQDLGRLGYQHYGLSPGGAMDEHASRWANHLLGNSPEAALLEVTLGQLELVAETACDIAITGAIQPISLNGTTVESWCSHRLEPGDRLCLGWASSGQRSYLAVRGGFQLPAVFDSVSTVVREQIGGLSGEPLQEGDFLPCIVDSYKPRKRQVPWRFIPDYEAPLTCRVMLGYQADGFSEQGLKTFFQNSYTLSPDSNRMGFRLQGPPVVSGLSGLLSEGIGYGAIQVPPDGQPIVLMKDRQTLGGYPKLGSLLPLDAFRLSQCRPGTSVSFVPIELEQAQQLMREFYGFFATSW